MTLTDFKKLKLPDEPGVYFFRGRSKEILYIGKATSLRDRVKSYFSPDLIFTRGPVIEKIVSEAKTVTFLIADSVLEALILEAKLIKKHQPKGNSMQKDDKSYNYVVITKEKFPRVLLSRGKDVPRDFPPKNRLYIIGPFPEGSLLKAGMRIIRKIFPFRDTCVPGQGRPCFNRQIGLCPGVCSGEISEALYKKTIRNLILFFEGGKRTLIGDLSKEMKTYAKAREFEKANETKRTLFGLEHIQDIALIKEEPSLHKEGSFRIEAYDIAHMGGKEMTGVMVVIEDGKAKKTDYRKFRIRTISGSDDTGALKEVLSRRFRHEEWPLPDLIVVDGGVAQRNAADRVLEKEKFKIPVISVVKDERHKPRDIEGEEALVRTHRRGILLGNAEAHRFAISYHKKLRRRKFLPG
jgi:excinuclease ABC subunit C